MASEVDEVGVVADDVHGPVRNRLGRVEHEQRADLAHAFGDPGRRVGGPEDVRHEHDRDELGAFVDELIQIGLVQTSGVGETEPTQRGAGPLAQELPRHDV